MKTTKTQRRADWLARQKANIEGARTKITVPERCKGYNAATTKGMSSGGWGYWVWALKQAGIRSDCLNYWSGSAPTPSTAINKGIADYIWINAPAELK